jgi:predicted phage tail protein
MFEDGKIYLTGEAIRRLGREWKLGLKGVRKRLELLGLVREGRTRKSINGTIQHAYIYTWTKNGQKMDNKWTKDGQPLEP